nr:recombinase family protein [Tumebacillus amylolyticus]
MAGSVPYGYRYNEQTQRLDIEPEQAQVVRSIFSLYTKQKLGYQAIAKHIEKLEIPTATGRAKWHPEVIHRLLQKSVYIGQVQFRKTERKNGKLIQRPKDEWIVVENAHEPIINREVWLACQKRMGKQNEKLPVNKNHTPWELTSLIICGECGKKMQRQFTTQQYQKKNGENSIYEKEFLRCECGVYVKYREVENRLLEVMERISLDGKQLNEQLATSLLRHETDHALPHVDMLEQIEQEIELLRKKLARSYDLVVEGVFSSKEFEKRRDQYQAKLQIKEQKAALMRKEHEQSIQDQEQSQNALYDLRTPPSNLMQAYEMIKHRELRNRLLRICFEQILLHVEKKGRGRKPTTFTLRLNTSFFVSLSQTLK